MKLLLACATTVALAVPAPASAELAVGARSAGDGWLVRVSASATGLGPVDVTVGHVRRAQAWGRSWLEHDLVLTNSGGRKVAFADTWRADLLGPRGRPMLVAEADGRCGYRAVRPLRAVCVLPLIFVDIAPGRSVTRVTTLWKGLRRMDALEPGRYVFRQPFRFTFGANPPPEGEGHNGAIEVVYRVEASS